MSSQESIRKARARALQAGRNAEAPEAARPGRNLLVPGAAIAVGIGGVSAAVAARQAFSRGSEISAPERVDSFEQVQPPTLDVFALRNQPQQANPLEGVTLPLDAVTASVAATTAPTPTRPSTLPAGETTSTSTGSADTVLPRSGPSDEDPDSVTTAELPVYAATEADDGPVAAAPLESQPAGQADEPADDSPAATPDTPTPGADYSHQPEMPPPGGPPQGNAPPPDSDEHTTSPDYTQPPNGVDTGQPDAQRFTLDEFMAHVDDSGSFDGGPDDLDRIPLEVLDYYSAGDSLSHEYLNAIYYDLAVFGPDFWYFAVSGQGELPPPRYDVASFHALVSDPAQLDAMADLDGDGETSALELAYFVSHRMPLEALYHYDRDAVQLLGQQEAADVVAEIAASTLDGWEQLIVSEPAERLSVEEFRDQWPQHVGDFEWLNAHAPMELIERYDLHGDGRINPIYESWGLYDDWYSVDREEWIHAIEHGLDVEIDYYTLEEVYALVAASSDPAMDWELRGQIGYRAPSLLQERYGSHSLQYQDSYEAFLAEIGEYPDAGAWIVAVESQEPYEPVADDTAPAPPDDGANDYSPLALITEYMAEGDGIGPAWFRDNAPPEVVARYAIDHRTGEGTAAHFDVVRAINDAYILGPEAWVAAIESGASMPLDSELSRQQFFEMASGPDGEQALLDAMDLNGDGTVSGVEFSGFAQYLLPAVVRQHYEQEWGDASNWSAQAGPAASTFYGRYTEDSGASPAAGVEFSGFAQYLLPAVVRQHYEQEWGDASNWSAQEGPAASTFYGRYTEDSGASPAAGIGAFVAQWAGDAALAVDDPSSPLNPDSDAHFSSPAPNLYPIAFAAQSMSEHEFLDYLQDDIDSSPVQSLLDLYGGHFDRAYYDMRVLGTDGWVTRYSQGDRMPYNTRLDLIDVYRDASRYVGDDPGEALYGLVDANGDGEISEHELTAFARYRIPQEVTIGESGDPAAVVRAWSAQMVEAVGVDQPYQNWVETVTSLPEQNGEGSAVDPYELLYTFAADAITIDAEDFPDWAAQHLPEAALARYTAHENLRDVFDGGTPGADYRRLYLELQLIGDEAWASAVASNSALPLESRLTTSQLYQEAMAAPGNGDPGDALFDLIDRNNDGHISHAEYFGFQEYLLPQGVPPGDSQYAGDWSDNARGWADEVGGQMAAAGSYETWADSPAIIPADALFSINNADDGTSPDGSGDGSGAQSDVAPGPAETNGDAGAGNDVVAPPLTPLELYQRADEFYNGIFLGGYLDQAEIQYVFAAFPPALLVHYDGDGDGQLSHDELAQALTHARSSASYEEWTAEFDSGSIGVAPIFPVGSDEIEIRAGAENEAPAPGFESDDDGQFGADAGDGEDLDAV